MDVRVSEVNEVKDVTSSGCSIVAGMGRASGGICQQLVNIDGTKTYTTSS